MQHIYMYAIPVTLYAGRIDLLAVSDSSQVFALCLPVAFLLSSSRREVGCAMYYQQNNFVPVLPVSDSQQSKYLKNSACREVWVLKLHPDHLELCSPWWKYFNLNTH